MSKWPRTFVWILGGFGPWGLDRQSLMHKQKPKTKNHKRDEVEIEMEETRPTIITVRGGGEELPGFRGEDGLGRGWDRGRGSNAVRSDLLASAELEFYIRGESTCPVR